MKNFFFLILVLGWLGCKSFSETSYIAPIELKAQIQIDTFPMPCSIRAITVQDENTMWFGGSNNQFGYTNDGGKSWQVNAVQHSKKEQLEFRGIAKNTDALFLLAIGSPALLFKSLDNGKNWKVVYEENHSKAFYDAIAFWDDKNGIAMGDPTDGCLSIILTKDGGESWTKIPCENLPPAADGEAAFAASNSNIALAGNHAWIVSGGKKARVFHSPDRGEHWEVFNTPINQGGTMTGIFTVAFNDDKNGIIFGGDWENQTQNTQNKAITKDSGQTWTLIADGKHPGYRSTVQYVPDSQGQAILAAGIPGISYSDDGGQHWTLLQKSSFYTLQFSPSGKTVWLAGKNKIGRMRW